MDKKLQKKDGCKRVFSNFKTRTRLAFKPKNPWIKKRLPQGHDKEAQTLIESGFEYVTSMHVGQMSYELLRKKKTWRLS